MQSRTEIYKDGCPVPIMQFKPYVTFLKSPHKLEITMKEKAYYETINVKNEVKLIKLLVILSPFCKYFFIGIVCTSSFLFKIAYAYDIGCFFDYLHATNPVCAKMDITDFPISILNEITPMDIEEYLSYLKYYEKDGTEHTNDEGGLKRKLSALRSFYHYYYKNGLIEDDPTVKVDMPKIHEKNIMSGCR